MTEAALATTTTLTATNDHPTSGRFWVMNENQTAVAAVTLKGGRLENFMVGQKVGQSDTAHVFTLTSHLRLGTLPPECPLVLVPQS